MGSRRNHWERPAKIGTGTIEDALHDRIAAIDQKPIIPGHYNSTLGTFVAASSHHREAVRKAEKLKRKARITLARVW